MISAGNCQLILQGVEMLIQGPQSWAAVIDGVQVFLLLVVLILIFRDRALDKQKARKAPETNDPRGFNAEMLTQAMQQQLEQSFLNIIASACIERSSLERVLQSGQTSSEKPSQRGLQPLAETSSPANQDFAAWEERRQHIEKLAGRGASIQHISEKLKIPRAEIELILNLKKAGS
jgi:hypothetical protein